MNSLEIRELLLNSDHFDCSEEQVEAIVQSVFSDYESINIDSHKDLTVLSDSVIMLKADALLYTCESKEKKSMILKFDSSELSIPNPNVPNIDFVIEFIAGHGTSVYLNGEFYKAKLKEYQHDKNLVLIVEEKISISNKNR